VAQASRASVARPDISVLIPARNEKSKVAATIKAISRARTSGARVEFVVVDDASTDGTVTDLVAAIPSLMEESKIDVRVCSLDRRVGNFQCRNQAAAIASADIFFITDAHVEFSEGWDEEVLRHMHPNRMLAATVTQKDTPFRGYGCSLLVPLMRTSWNQQAREAVPVSVCSATIIGRELFQKLGGYDPGMLLWGGGGPEFSVRAWLHGAEVCSLASVEVQHEFKTPQVFANFMASIRLYWVHNCIRFGLLYLTELGCLQLLRYYARAFPAFFQQALQLIEDSDVWIRRAALEHAQQRSFAWFVRHFDMNNQAGGAIV
jgi:glycosyltransferase involved in cell wall biosynthesis